MRPLEYTLTNDTLFKMLFVRHVDLLKSLVSALLDIPSDSITDFAVTNPEIQPDTLGDKFCRLDINMLVSGRRVDLEVQVKDEHDYPERSLYYWARDFSSALGEGGDYADLPRTVVVSIVAFEMWVCADFHSEFRPLEVNRRELLTDKMSLHYFELPKVPQTVGADDKLKLWLALFNAKTEEDLARIEALEVPEMLQTVGAMKNIIATEKFRELERERSKSRHNEAAALRFARDEGKLVGATEERAKWRGVLAEMETENAALLARLAELEALLEN